ncbi:DNase I-like protein [Conidiobolus coronatus NRRL 28638]|uniref:DNase I-like protein n=1 Tax=Conidiobolus coronatus (strain ATCC 28846 / CBS 209.66 / NRRL 28638) TaxID=796925 RepID=A0A137PET4_CONC2|nr:DNase I-like protein [Conidiobolus coronatus NRRL 28638]|eukprot:KXN73461.1 DNase I-like protein [Conidiobolus coronatus NRRL 28638]
MSLLNKNNPFESNSSEGNTNSSNSSFQKSSSLGLENTSNSNSQLEGFIIPNSKVNSVTSRQLDSSSNSINSKLPAGWTTIENNLNFKQKLNTSNSSNNSSTSSLLNDIGFTPSTVKKKPPPVPAKPSYLSPTLLSPTSESNSSHGSYDYLLSPESPTPKVNELSKKFETISTSTLDSSNSSSTKGFIPMPSKTFPPAPTLESPSSQKPISLVQKPVVGLRKLVLKNGSSSSGTSDNPFADSNISDIKPDPETQSQPPQHTSLLPPELPVRPSTHPILPKKPPPPALPTKITSHTTQSGSIVNLPIVISPSENDDYQPFNGNIKQTITSPPSLSSSPCVSPLFPPLSSSLPTKPILPPKPSQSNPGSSTPKPALPPKPRLSHGRKGSSSIYSSSPTSPPLLPSVLPSDTVLLQSRVSKDHKLPLLDTNRANRSKPRLNYVSIFPKNPVKCFTLCCHTVCTGSHSLKMWSPVTGDNTFAISAGEQKVTAVCFRPSRLMEEEGKFVWYGLTDGQLGCANVLNGQVVDRKLSAHNYPILAILKYKNLLWTIDEMGTLNIWGDNSQNSLNIHTASSFDFKLRSTNLLITKNSIPIIVGDELWVTTGKTLQVYTPLQEDVGNCLSPLHTLDLGSAESPFTCIAYHPKRRRVYTGHLDGRLTIWNANTYTRIGTIVLNSYRIGALLIVANQYLWVAVTRKIYVFDISRLDAWVLIKEWEAHDSPIIDLVIDHSSLFKLSKLQVGSLGENGRVQIWDGLMTDDWQSRELETKQENYCKIRDINTLICSWNIDAIKPSDLATSTNVNFLEQWLTPGDILPDIIVVGFQEAVDLESKRVTAKAILKKMTTDSGDITQRYKLWQDRLTRVLHSAYPSEAYSLIECQNLVGLFSCVFVKEKELPNVRNLSVSLLKTGFGGYHGNKGGISIRFTLDDTALCFVNCHLAAGQTQIQNRNTDVANILKKTNFDPVPSEGVFVDGGDASQILDHEICFVSGDLNYRIDLDKASILEYIHAKQFSELIKYDQLYQLRSGIKPFILRLFSESEIKFSPTYKYDPFTNNYDTSEKQRSPAWCDRILYRGKSIRHLEYSRFECDASDHRPIRGLFKCSIKSIIPDRLNKLKGEISKVWDTHVERLMDRQMIDWFSQRGYTPDKAKLTLEKCKFDFNLASKVLFEESREELGL